jgi:hypothetical protein
MLQKKCTKCGVSKDLTEYHTDMRLKNRTRAGCKNCISERMKVYRQRPEVKERERAYRQRPEVKERINLQRRQRSQKQRFTRDMSALNSLSTIAAKISKEFN